MTVQQRVIDTARHRHGDYYCCCCCCSYVHNRAHCRQPHEFTKSFIWINDVIKILCGIFLSNCSVYLLREASSDLRQLVCCQNVWKLRVERIVINTARRFLVSKPKQLTGWYKYYRNKHDVGSLTASHCKYFSCCSTNKKIHAVYIGHCRLGYSLRCARVSRYITYFAEQPNE